MRRVAIGAVASVVVIGLLYAVVPVGYAPRINIRWTDGVDDQTRRQLESNLGLEAGEQRDGNTWQYDLGDPSATTIRQIIADPRVADTYQIDRTRGTVERDAPRGKTRIHGTLSSIRDAPILLHILTFAGSCLVLSFTWLLVDHFKGAHRHAENVP